MKAIYLVYHLVIYIYLPVYSCCFIFHFFFYFFLYCCLYRGIGIIYCTSRSFFRGLYRLSGNQATIDFLKYGKCCKPAIDPPYYGRCYYQYVSSFDRPGLFKCKDHYYIKAIRTRNCSQLHCIDWFSCCTMETGIRWSS